MAFEVSATMTILAPAPLVIAICALAASNSSRAERLSNSVEYQPATKSMPNEASLPFRAAPSVGILWPFSIPSIEASLASSRHFSSGVSPPISCRSSLVQPIGLAPMRMVISVSNPLQLLRVLVSAPRGADLLPLGDRRYGDVPPEAAGVGRADRVGVNDDHLGRIGRPRLFERRLELGDRIGLNRFRPQRARMGDEVDRGQRLMPRVAQEIVERRAAGRLLQPVDAGEAAVVEDDDNELPSQHHRGGDLRIHHQV